MLRKPLSPTFSRRGFLAAGSAATLAVSTSGLRAQSAFPSEAIQILMGVGPGGGTDRSARLFGPYWEAALPGSEPVTFLPRPGGSGLVALEYMRAQPSSGYFPMYFPVPHIASLFNLGKVPGGQLSDVAWIGTLFTDPDVLLVPKDSPYETIAEFVEASKAADEPFTISGSTPLSNAHFATIVLAEKTGANLRFVPFGGGGDARNAVAGGHVDGCIAPYWSALGVLELTKAIGIFGDENPAPDLWQPVPVNEVLDVDMPDLLEPYAMFCSASVRDENPDAFETLTTAFSEAVASEAFRAAAKQDNLTPFLSGWDSETTQAFAEEYIALFNQYLSAMEKDLETL
mgnify:CR=1 FL=1